MRSEPTATGSGESDVVSETFATGSTVVVSEAELSAALGSCSAADAEAEFVISPGLSARTTICTVAEEEAASVPRSHVTVPEASEQVPCEGVADW